MRWCCFCGWMLLLLLELHIGSQRAESAKILAVFPWPGRSQYIFAENYLKELAARDHQVTVINTWPGKQTPNMRLIVVPQIQSLISELLSRMMNVSLYWQLLTANNDIQTTLTKCIFDHVEVQQLLQSGEQFDLVIVETCQTEALYGLAQHFNATLMGMSSYGTDWHIDNLMGNTSPLAYSPLITSARTDRMSFGQRLQNLYELLVEQLHTYWVHMPQMQQLYAKYFPHARQTLPQVLDSFTLMLLGQHFSLSHARPYVPNMIEIGGLHIAHGPQPLPAHIKTFIEQAEHGVIYFSLGSNIKSKDLPLATRQLLLQVFGGLKQRVLWKFELEELPNKPENVLISNWFPQPDILAHANVKLFITHGGLLSTIESIYHGKPVLGLPVFYDQFMNVQRARRMGFGLGLDLQNLQQAQLEQSIAELLTTPRYAQAAALLSSRYRDQPQPAMERAIWWTEYVLRHRGAPHMRVTARDLNFMQLHSLDTIGVLIVLPAVLLLMLLYFSCRLLKGQKVRENANKKGQ